MTKRAGMLREWSLRVNGSDSDRTLTAVGEGEGRERRRGGVVVVTVNWHVVVLKGRSTSRSKVACCF